MTQTDNIMSKIKGCETGLAIQFDLLFQQAKALEKGNDTLRKENEELRAGTKLLTKTNDEMEASNQFLRKVAAERYDEIQTLKEQTSEIKGGSYLNKFALEKALKENKELADRNKRQEDSLYIRLSENEKLKRENEELRARTKFTYLTSEKLDSAPRSALIIDEQTLEISRLKTQLEDLRNHTSLKINLLTDRLARRQEIIEIHKRENARLNALIDETKSIIDETVKMLANYC